MEDGSVTGRETSIFTAPTDETEADTLSALLSQYYLPRGVLPREILLPFAVDELSGLETVLTSRAGASRHAARAAARRKGGTACHGRTQRP